MTLIGDVLNSWESFGFFSIALPFILVFTIIYGMLVKTEIFDKKSVNAIIAASGGLVATAFGYYTNCLSIFVIASVISITGIFILYIGVGFFTKETKKATIFAGAIVLITFYISFTTFNQCKLFSFNPSWPVWILLIIIGGLIFWILHDQKDSNKDKKR